MLKVFLAFLLIASSQIISQNKYFIYFNDKGLNKISNEKLQELKQLAISKLDPKAIQRRLKSGMKEIINEKDFPIPEKYISLLNDKGIAIDNKLKWFNAVSAYLTASQIESVISLPFVKKIEKVKILNCEDKIISQSFNLKSNAHNNVFTSRMNYGLSLRQLQFSDIPFVHDNGITGKGVRIGILDTGFDWKIQPSLQNVNVIAEYDFVNNDNVTANQSNDLNTQDTHGTAILSVIGGYKPGDLIGGAFDAEFVLAKTENEKSETHTEEDNYAAALEWFEGRGVDISTSSLGYSTFDDGQTSYSYSQMDGISTIVSLACEYAFQRGMLVVSSAGNEGNKPWKYITSPGDGFNVLTVGAVSTSKAVAGFSGVGPTSDGRLKPEVAALGVSVFAADANSLSFKYLNGTSVSAPIVTSVAALVLSQFPHLNNKQLRSIIIESGDNVDNPDNKRGYGLVSAIRALSFPNVKVNENSITLNKMFMDSLYTDSNKPKFYISINNSNFNEEALTENSSRLFSYDFSSLNVGDSVKFYFTFTGSDGKEKREPASDYFTYEYGTEIISSKASDILFDVKPKDFYVSNNFPNPFNPETKIRYRLSSPLFVNAEVFDILGRKIKTVLNQNMSAGFYNLNINLSEFSSGVYFLVLKAGENIAVKKMLLTK